MDGVFVPNLTFGPGIVQIVRKSTKLPVDVHLMIVEPDRHIDAFAEAGADTLMVHVEAALHLQRTLAHIRSLGKRAGVVLNPHTPEDHLEWVLDDIDQVLVMTVNPGFGGQSYLPSMEPKIAEVRRMIDDAGRGEQVDVEVDGGISTDTVCGAVAAGANVLVAGTALYRDPAGLGHAVDELRERAAAARR
jgi:ribulose-phosphate 3-epimerase